VLDLAVQAREDLLGLIRGLMQCDRSFDLKLLDVLVDPRGDGDGVARAIDMLDRVSDGLRLLPLMRQILPQWSPQIRPMVVT
jgi:hypothetical protein